MHNDFFGYRDLSNYRVLWCDSLVINVLNTHESTEICRDVSETCINVSFAWNGRNEHHDSLYLAFASLWNSFFESYFQITNFQWDQLAVSQKQNISCFYVLHIPLWPVKWVSFPNISTSSSLIATTTDSLGMVFVVVTIFTSFDSWQDYL